MLALADLENKSEQEIKEHIAKEYSGSEQYCSGTEDEIAEVKSKLQFYDILIAYESVGDYGCDSTSYFLLRQKATKELFELRGSHCSCYGFEGQFELEPTTVQYLQSDKFYFYSGGYDDYAEPNKQKVLDFISTLKELV